MALCDFIVHPSFRLSITFVSWDEPGKLKCHIVGELINSSNHLLKDTPHDSAITLLKFSGQDPHKNLYDRLHCQSQHVCGSSC